MSTSPLMIFMALLCTTLSLNVLSNHLPRPLPLKLYSGCSCNRLAYGVLKETHTVFPSVEAVPEASKIPSRYGTVLTDSSSRYCPTTTMARFPPASTFPLTSLFLKFVLSLNTIPTQHHLQMVN